MVVFPPDGECEGGSMLAVHLNEVMANAAVRIIASLEQQMVLCEEARVKNALPASTSIPLCTFYDDLEERDANAAVKSKSKTYKKRPLGRVRKWMGDLSLQISSPLDALEHLAVAIAECRALGDSLWLAGKDHALSPMLILFVESRTLQAQIH